MATRTGMPPVGTLTDERDALELTGPGISRPIALVRWPAEAQRRSDLAVARQPRLLLLEPGVAPPLTWDDAEDWVRLPADPDELQARGVNLLRHCSPVSTRVPPVVDTDGIVRSGGEWVALAPIEARLLTRLLHQPGRVVPGDRLIAAGWPEGTGNPNLLNGRLRRLRARVAPLGLRITNVRGIGFLVELT